MSRKDRKRQSPDVKPDSTAQVPNDSARGKDPRLSGLNDMSWYDRYPELLESTAKIQFPYRPGRTVPVGSITAAGTSVKLATPIPGVMVMWWYPTIGWSSTNQDPASIAAKEIYAKVRNAYSGRLYADAPDFIVYMMALDSVFSYLGALKRVYRLLDAYEPNNYAVPDMLLQALGFSESERLSLRINKANLLLAINQLIRQSQKFVTPAVFDIMNRHYWMNDNVYADAETMNSQFYVFQQAGYFKYSLIDVPDVTPTVQAGGCTMVSAPWAPDVTTAVTVESLYSFGNQLLAALAGSEDAYTISGYLMRAFEGFPQFTVDLQEQVSQFVPVWQPEVLQQIENSEVLMSANGINPSNFTGLDIVQTPANNALIHQPTFKNAQVAAGDAAVLFDLQQTFSIRSDVPSVQDVVIASRLKPSYVLQSPGTGVEVHAATEIPLLWMVYVPSSGYWGNYANDNAGGSGGTGLVLASKYYIPLAYATKPASFNRDTIAALASIAAKTQFDWSPFCDLLIDQRTAASAAYNQPLLLKVGDTHNLTAISDEELSNLHRVCVYSEFNAFSI